MTVTVNVLVTVLANVVDVSELVTRRVLKIALAHAVLAAQAASDPVKVLRRR